METTYIITNETGTLLLTVRARGRADALDQVARMAGYGSHSAALFAGHGSGLQAVKVER